MGHRDVLMAKIAIIGAGGFIGGHVCAEALAQGHAVYGFFKSAPTDPAGILKRFAGVEISDCREPGFPERVSRIRPDAVIYCVSLDHRKSEEDVTETISVNLSPLVFLLRHLAGSENFCSFVYLSTAQIYGPIGHGTPLSPASSVSPRNLYALTHLFCEQAVEMYGRLADSDFLNVRITNSFGFPIFPSASSEWLVLNDFCKSAVRKGQISMSSDGVALRDFVWVRDVAKALVAHATKSETSGLVDFASGTSISVLDAAHVVSKVAANRTGRKVPVIGPKATGIGPNKSRQKIETFNPKYFRDLLGDQGSSGLEHAIEQLIEYELDKMEREEGQH